MQVKSLVQDSPLHVIRSFERKKDLAAAHLA